MRICQIRRELSESVLTDDETYTDSSEIVSESFIEDRPLKSERLNENDAHVSSVSQKLVRFDVHHRCLFLCWTHEVIQVQRILDFRDPVI
jgi:hypothetical protein